MRRMGETVTIPLDRWGEELGAPRTWLLYQLNAPVLSRSVRVVSPPRFRTLPELWLRPGFRSIIR
jgi:hypothetical protein